MTRKFNTLPMALLALLAASAPGLAQEAGLASYEATYRLTLGDIKYKGAVVTAKGAMAMRVRRDCARWQSQSELLFLLELDNGDKVRTHTMYRQRESLDGQNIDFVYWQDLSDAGRLEYRGTATIPLDGDAGSVRYVKPKRFERKLPKGVEMPIAAMRHIVEALITEGATPKHNYFDPQAKFVEIRNIGGDPIILAIPPKGDARLVDGRSWRLHATPIPEGQDEGNTQDAALKEEEEEAYTMMQIHDSGVASFMVMKSGITTIHAELTEVKQLPRPDCARPTPPDFELSNDCMDAKAGRKEDDFADGKESDVAKKPKEESGAPVAGLPANESGAAKNIEDCETVVERDKGAEGEDVQAAPVEDVEAEPVEDVEASPLEDVEAEPVDETGEQMDAADEEEPVETEPPALTNASVAN